ncbi:methylated-DNA--[protein]-cysteine S-methyltransferase [Methylonatrum kenyense]|uniref:methylated-DNA--[protein]-cysteine S-methyltransferase n=1 Tax=Methylonatrum kenyense TaxID=455253 RepID=UPI0024A6E791|nr:methylated-DNA--[protein]-cysteine S-methyltransferase [Methylonatrum kenyense]
MNRPEVSPESTGSGRLQRPKDGQTRFTIFACALGNILLADRPEGVCAVLLGDSEAELLAELRRRFPGCPLVADDAGLAARREHLLKGLDGDAVVDELPLAPEGTAFQQRVWQALRRIPAGSTASYSEIARWIGAPRSARAVAAACAANPIAVLIPCHRVLRQDGSLSGYRWGVERKRTLLAREAVS